MAASVDHRDHRAGRPFLAEFLLRRGYAVHGIVRRVALEDPTHRLWRLQSVLDEIHLHAASMESYASLFRVVEKIKPDECYHLAAQSFVDYSFDDEFSTITINVNGTHYLLSALKEKAPVPLLLRRSSEMFGQAPHTPQSETTSFHPLAVRHSKVAGFQLTRNYASLRDVRLQRDRLQPRVGAARLRVRDARSPAPSPGSS
jgi:GDPmannose 4,6-dehydratase